MKTITLSISDEAFDGLDQAAAPRRIPIDDLVRKALAKYAPPNKEKMEEAGKAPLERIHRSDGRAAPDYIFNLEEPYDR